MEFGDPVSLSCFNLFWYKMTIAINVDVFVFIKITWIILWTLHYENPLFLSPGPVQGGTGILLTSQKAPVHFLSNITFDEYFSVLVNCIWFPFFTLGMSARCKLFYLR